MICSCVDEIPDLAGRGELDFTCRCGRLYKAVAVDVGQLMRRIDELEERLRKLESKIEPSKQEK